MVPRRSTEDTPNPDHTQGEVHTQSASGTGSRSCARSDARIPMARRQCGSTSQRFPDGSATPPCGSTP